MLRSGGPQVTAIGASLGAPMPRAGPMLQHTVPENQQQNYVELWMQKVERCAKSCMLESGLPLRFMYHARLFVVHQLRRTLAPDGSGRTRWERLSGFPPTLYHSYPFGCLLHAFSRDKGRQEPNGAER